MAISKEYIIEYSTNLFTQNGVRSVRMDDISTELGISKRTLYEIFTDKESLIFECIKLHVKRKRELIRQAQKHNNILIELLYSINNHDKYIDKEQFINELRRFYPDIFKKFIDEQTKAMHKYLSTELVNGKKQGYIIEDVDVNIVALMIRDLFQTIIQHLSKNANIDINREDLNSSIRNLILYVLRGISTPKGVNVINEFLENNNFK